MVNIFLVSYISALYFTNLSRRVKYKVEIRNEENMSDLLLARITKCSIFYECFFQTKIIKQILRKFTPVVK